MPTVRPSARSLRCGCNATVTGGGSTPGVRGQAAAWPCEVLGRRSLPCLNQRARHRRAEDAVAFDLFMQVSQPIAVALHGKVGHRPDHLAEEEDHRADVEELEP